MKIKHSISLLLVIVLLFGMAIPAYAEETDPTIATGNDSIAVISPEIPIVTEEISSTSGQKIDSVLGVEITWNVPTLKIQLTEKYAVKWNPETLKYEKTDEGNSSSAYRLGETNDLNASQVKLGSVSNRSLFEIAVTGTFTPHEELSEIDFSFMNIKCENLPAATAGIMTGLGTENWTCEEGTKGEAQDIYLYGFDSLSKPEGENILNIVKEKSLTYIGTVTLTFSKAA